MARALVALGANLDPARNLPRAVRLVAARARVVAVSPVYESPPAAGARGPEFWNAAVLVETDLPPAALKAAVLREVEARLGRVRTADKNAPRTIDLDLVLYGDAVIDDPAAGLRIPDPDIVRHAHVAVPLGDVAPDVVHPTDGRTLGEIARAFDRSSTLRRVRLDLASAAAGVSPTRGW